MKVKLYVPTLHATNTTLHATNTTLDAARLLNLRFASIEEPAINFIFQMNKWQASTAKNAEGRYTGARLATPMPKEVIDSNHPMTYARKVTNPGS